MLKTSLTPMEGQIPSGDVRIAVRNMQHGKKMGSYGLWVQMGYVNVGILNLNQ